MYGDETARSDEAKRFVLQTAEQLLADPAPEPVLPSPDRDRQLTLDQLIDFSRRRA
ncbi:hypothetical protein GCM10010411_73480 [Actinomadura fulvescens]|uniref:Uncharacterized protein n=1 Tax=Actinomadura fulvescens TaxID=46160 RepID=A0ABP6CW89_9ACTN